jgi:ParB family chromosome partitioning protein
MGDGTIQIPLDQITPNPHQPRKEMNEAGIAELAASLKSTGLIQPVILRKTEAGYQLIAGERRLRAAKLAGLDAIPAIVRNVDSFTQAQMALVENIQREDLNPIDRALAYRALTTQLGLTHQELAIRLGEDRSSITNYVRLLDLAEPVRELVRTRMLHLGHAKLLASVADLLEQQRLAELCVAQDLSVRNLERLLAGTPAAPPVARTVSTSPHIADLEQSIARQLGMRVQIRSARKGKGRLVVHYASLDQFDDLMKRMGVKVE